MKIKWKRENKDQTTTHTIDIYIYRDAPICVHVLVMHQLVQKKNMKGFCRHYHTFVEEAAVAIDATDTNTKLYRHLPRVLEF